MQGFTEGPPEWFRRAFSDSPVLVHNCDVSLSQAEADTLGAGPYADKSVPAAGPVVMPEESAAMQGRACHSCGGSSPTMTGDHQLSTGIVPTSLPRSLFPHCETAAICRQLPFRKHRKYCVITAITTRHLKG